MAIYATGYICIADNLNSKWGNTGTKNLIKTIKKLYLDVCTKLLYLMSFIKQVYQPIIMNFTNQGVNITNQQKILEKDKQIMNLITKI